jgi:hypothetical protein
VFVKEEINFKIYLGSNSCEAHICFSLELSKPYYLWAVKAHLPLGYTTKMSELHIHHKVLSGSMARALRPCGQVWGSIPQGLFFLE